MPPKPTLTFRNATIDDAPTVLDLVESAYRGESSRQGWTTEADLLEGQRTDLEGVAAVINGEQIVLPGRPPIPASMIRVAEEDGQMLACCQIEIKEEGHAYFGMFAVKPGLQGRGIGRTMVEEVERIAVEVLGATTLTMVVFRQRTELIAWYERLGFVATGETSAFPYGDERFGLPMRDDLEFLTYAKVLNRSSVDAGL